MKRHYIIYYLLQFTWGIIQNLIGFAVWIFCLIKYPKNRRLVYRGSFVTTWEIRSGLGLGAFIFVGHNGNKIPENILSHEYGHTLQSMILGPLFIFIIGVPSILWASLPFFKKLRKERKLKYIDFYPEKWAERLGNKIK